MKGSSGPASEALPSYEGTSWDLNSGELGMQKGTYHIISGSVCRLGKELASNGAEV